MLLVHLVAKIAREKNETWMKYTNEDNGKVSVVLTSERAAHQKWWGQGEPYAPFLYYPLKL